VWALFSGIVVEALDEKKYISMLVFRYKVMGRKGDEE